MRGLSDMVSLEVLLNQKLERDENSCYNCLTLVSEMRISEPTIGTLIAARTALIRNTGGLASTQVSTDRLIQPHS